MNSNVQHGSCIFTVEIPEWIGLSDKLWHISKLHSLGRALSYDYAHTPFSCARSSSSSYFSKSIFRSLKRVVDFRNAQPNSSDYLGKFLGLERRKLNVHDSIFKGYKKTNILLDDIFQNEKFSSLTELKEIIDSKEKEANIKIFTTEWGIYSYVDRIDELLNQASKEEKYYLEELELEKYYWLARSKDSIDVGFLPGKVKVLVHIRIGDTASFKMGERILSLHSTCVRLIETEDDFIDKSRKPIALEKFSNILEEIFQTYNQDNFSVIVISDGYGRTLEVFLRALLKREITLNLSQILTVIQEIYRSEKRLRSLSKRENTSLIIGESKQKLLKSIHAIADADVVVLSSGGFARIVHTFFKRRDQPTVMVDARSYSERDLEEIGNLASLMLSDGR